MGGAARLGHACMRRRGKGCDTNAIGSGSPSGISLALIDDHLHALSDYFQQSVGPASSVRSQLSQAYRMPT